jgi:hypothetical protein
MAVLASGGAVAAQEIPVLTTSAGEFQPVRGENHLAWERSTKAQPKHFDVLVRPDGGSPLRVNRQRKSGALGDIDGDRLVYQEFRKRKSDLHFYNLTTGQRSRLPKAANTRHWEYWPSLSDPWLLFGRWNMKQGWRRLFLYNMDTGEKRVVHRTRAERAFIGPGQVNGDFAVWSTCPPKGKCQVYRYHIPSGTTIRMPNPGAHQRAPSVTPGGTVYLRRGGPRCGDSVRLIRLDGSGSDTTLIEFPQAIDSGDTYAYTESNGVTHLYYERVGCGGRAASDIYKVTDPELASLSVAVAGTGTGIVHSSPTGIECGQDCSETYPLNATVTLQADPAPDSYFAGWSGACSGTGECTLSMNAAKSVMATFHLVGSITVVKEAFPSDPQDFSFTTTGGLEPPTFSLDDDEDGTLPNEIVFADLPARTYTVSEINIPSGWGLTGLDCTGGGPNTAISGPTAVIGLDPGEDVTCTFSNAQVGTISVVKDALPNDPQDFGFSTGGLSPATFSLDDDADGTLSNVRTFTGLLPGTYTVSEDADPPGWQLTDITCLGGGENTSDTGRKATIGLDSQEAVICTFTNTKEGSITVVKDALPNDPQDFGFSTTNLSPATFSLDDDADGTLSNTRTFTGLLPGTYTVTEEAVSGWQLTDLECVGGGPDTTDSGRTATIGLDPGEDVVCTFENTQEGSITIVLDVVPDDPQDFTFSTMGGLSPANFTLDDDDDLPLPSAIPDTQGFLDVLPHLGVLAAFAAVLLALGTWRLRAALTR